MTTQAKFPAAIDRKFGYLIGMAADRLSVGAGLDRRTMAVLALDVLVFGSLDRIVIVRMARKTIFGALIFDFDLLPILLVSDAMPTKAIASRANPKILGHDEHTRHEDPNDPVTKIITTQRVAVLKPEFGTNPQVYYIGLDEEVH